MKLTLTPKPTTPTSPLPSLGEQLEAAEGQDRRWRAAQAGLESHLRGLRTQQQAAMRAALATQGDSKELREIRTQITEIEAQIAEAEQFVADTNILLTELHQQVAATRTAEEKARIAVEVARLTVAFKSRLAEHKANIETASKSGGALLIVLGEINEIDGAACSPLIAEARWLDHKADLLAAGWKIGRFHFGQLVEWWVTPLLPPVPGLESYPEANIKGYLRLRDKAAQAAPGAQQGR